MGYNFGMSIARVAVLRGGPSEEYNVSLKTGQHVLDSLVKRGLKTVDVLVNRQGHWLVDGFHKKPEEALTGVDAVFIAMHGQYGEDGEVQRLLERFHLPYVGSKAYPSAVAFNKLLTKEALKSQGVKVPAHFKVSREMTDLSRIVHTIESLFGPNYIVKPVNSGSSLGIKTASGGGELLNALRTMLQEREAVMVEERLRGREASVGVLERFRGRDLYALPVTEIVGLSVADFYDFENKYNGRANEICPGNFSLNEKAELERLASLVHQSLGLSQWSRSDFILVGNDVYFLEVNTLPALTPDTIFGRSLESVGSSIDDLVWHLLLDSHDTHRTR